MDLDKIEVVTDYKHLQIREITDSGAYHRRVLTPDMTLADDEHEEIKDKQKNFGLMKLRMLGQPMKPQKEQN